MAAAPFYTSATISADMTSSIIDIVPATQPDRNKINSHSHFKSVSIRFGEGSGLGRKGQMRPISFWSAS